MSVNHFKTLTWKVQEKQKLVVVAELIVFVLIESGDKPPLETEVIPHVQPDRTTGVVEAKPEPGQT